MAAQTPITTIQAFQRIVDKYGSNSALHQKRDGEWYVAVSVFVRVHGRWIREN